MQCICLKTGRRSIWSVIHLSLQFAVGVETGRGGWNPQKKPHANFVCLKILFSIDLLKRDPAKDVEFLSKTDK